MSAAWSNLGYAAFIAILGAIDLAPGLDNPRARAMEPYRRAAGYLCLVAAAVMIILAWTEAQPGDQPWLAILSVAIPLLSLICFISARRAAAKRLAESEALQ
jgi:hypothetical protein